jgi:hypothetical protein
MTILVTPIKRAWQYRKGEPVPDWAWPLEFPPPDGSWVVQYLNGSVSWYSPAEFDAQFKVIE